MAKERVENTKVYSLTEFNNSDLSKTMSYKDYLKLVLQQSLYEVPSKLKLDNPGSTFGFGFKKPTNPLEIKKELAMQDAEELQEKIEAESEARVADAEKAKANAEEEYYAALAQAKTAENTKNETYQNVQHELRTARKKTSKYRTLLSKFRILEKLSLNKNIDLEIAADHFNDANKVAYNTFLSTRNFG